MNIVINILVSGLLVIVATYLTPGAHVDSYLTAVIVAILLGLVNSTIGYVMKVATLPLNILTLGLTSLIINVLMVLIVARVISGFTLDGFFPALIFAIVLAIISMIIGGRQIYE